MLSIKGGSELLVYGGNVGGGPLNGIWKYRVDKVSISSTFYKQLFCTHSLGMFFFWWKEIRAKAAHQMLVKLTQGFLDTIWKAAESQSWTCDHGCFWNWMSLIYLRSVSYCNLFFFPFHFSASTDFWFWNIEIPDTEGQFYKPFGAKRKCPGAPYLA